MHEKPALLEFLDASALTARFPRSDAGEPGWLPAVDLREDEEELVLLAALPGVAKEDIVIEVEAEAVTLRGRRREPQAGAWLRRELHAGPFARRVALPSAVTAELACAAHRDGILEVRLPKEKPGQARTLTVQ